MNNDSALPVIGNNSLFSHLIFESILDFRQIEIVDLAPILIKRPSRVHKILI